MIVDHSGISFTRLHLDDAGLYTVKARVQSKEVKAASTLKGV